MENRWRVKPAWSPDGEWIAFNNENGTLGDIYLIKPDGTDLRRLTSTADISRDGNLVWSPDSKAIAFSADRDGNIEIYILNVAEVLMARRWQTASADTNHECQWNEEFCFFLVS